MSTSDTRLDGAVELRHLDPTPTAVRRATLRVTEIGSWLAGTYGAVAAVLAAQRIGPAGPPFARYHLVEDDRFEVEAGFVATHPVAATVDVEASSLPGGPAAVTLHVGPYDAMEPTYTRLQSWLTTEGYRPEGDAWEIYLSDPNTEHDPATWRTEVVMPCAPA